MDEAALDEFVQSPCSRETTQFLLHPLYLLGYTLTLAATSRLTDTLSSYQSTVIVLAVVLLRSAGCVTLPSLPLALRPAITYLAGLLGILVAKFTETSLVQPDVIAIGGCGQTQMPLLTSSGSGGSGGSGSRRTSAVDHESRVMAARRRRTSSAALTSMQPSTSSSSGGQPGATQGNAPGNNKVRRTSLPALLANKKDHLLVPVSPPHRLSFVFSSISRLVCVPVFISIYISIECAIVIVALKACRYFSTFCAVSRL